MTTFRLRDIRPNPFRNIDHYPIRPDKIEALRASIKSTSFWDNIVARAVDGGAEIAYGHHRLVALREEYGDDHQIDLIIRDLDDETMLRMMADDNQHLMNLIIADIQIPQGREPRRNVRVLIESIEKVGLLNPITVRATELYEAGAEPRAGYRLVAGLNRLEAMKQLGHDEIPATIVSLEDLEYRLAEFDENLIRSDIPVIDQGARLEEHKQIYEALYPETGWGKTRRNNKESKECNLHSFADDAAAKIGTSNDTVKRLIRVGRLPDNIKDLVRGTPLADNQHELLKLQHIKHQQDQRNAVEAYLSGAATTITGPKKRGSTKNERQQAAEELAEILIEHIPADLWPQVGTYLKLDKATVTLSAFRKLQKATVA